MQEQDRTPYALQSRREMGANQHAQCIEDGVSRPLPPLGGEPRQPFGRLRIGVKAITKKGVRPGVNPAFVELALPDLDPLNRSAEVGTVADGESGDALG